MFTTDGIVIHSDCVETDVQLRGWMLVKGEPDKGYPLARAMCQVVSELKHKSQFVESMGLRPYSKQKMAVREYLRSRGQPKPQMAYSRDSAWKDLVR